MIVVCNRPCVDSAKSIKYYPGDSDDIDPFSPIAAYFTFPDGTEVYHKIKGTKDSPPVETTRIVGGEIKAKVDDAAPKEAEEKFLCVCGFESKSKAGLASHFRACDVVKSGLTDSDEDEKEEE